MANMHSHHLQPQYSSPDDYKIDSASNPSMFPNLMIAKSANVAF